MAKLFISHSSRNNVEAVAIREWLRRQGWDDVFLDLDPARGIEAGQRWREALNQAANRCEAVLILLSRAWLASHECLRELALADKLNKTLLCALIEDIPRAELPRLATGTWQLVDLVSGRDHEMIEVVLPKSLDRQAATFSREGLARLKAGLIRTGLDPAYFAWPPKDDPKRPPYAGLRPLDAADAGIFFGREAQTVEALDRLRAIREAPGSRFLCLLGASGSGKSSFLRAGLWPRLARDDRAFLPLPVLRPERAALSGRSGLVAILGEACEAQGLATPRAAIREAVAGGAASVRPLLSAILAAATARHVADDERGAPPASPPLLVLPIDQGEELFGAEGAEESAAILALLGDLLGEDAPALAVVMTIRSDAFERLQLAPQVSGQEGENAAGGIEPRTMAFGPMPRGLYANVIEGPAARMREADRSLVVDPALTRALLEDMEEGGGRDALPLLAFTLERLWLDYGASGRLTLADYDRLGRVRGSIESAVEEVFRKADAEPRIPRDRAARLTLLRRGLVPWLAGIDPDTNTPRRRIARRSEIPAEAAPLIDLLVEERLLSADSDPETGEATIEPAHEALLRQWGLLQGWLEDDLGKLAALEGVRRATRDWNANLSNPAWLVHGGDRLAEAERLSERPDLSAQLGGAERDYLAACRARAEREASEARARRRMRQVLQWGGIAAALVFGVLLVLAITQWRDAVTQRDLADRQTAIARARADEAARAKERADKALTNAKEAASSLIFDIAQKLRNRGQSIATVREVLGQAETLMTRLVASVPDDGELQSMQSAMYAEFATTYEVSGDTVRQKEAAERSVALARRLVANHPSSAIARGALALALARLGEAEAARGDPAARRTLEESLEIGRRVREEHPADPEPARWVSSSLIGIGNFEMERGNLAEALTRFGESVAILRGLVRPEPAASEVLRDLSVALERCGTAQQRRGQFAAARDTFEEALAIHRRFAAADPSDRIAQQHLSVSLAKVGGIQSSLRNFDEALKRYGESLAIQRRLAEADPSNARAQSDLAKGLAAMGAVQAALDPADAVASHEESLAIFRRLAEADPANSQTQKNLAVSLSALAELRRSPDERRKLAEESLAIFRRLAEADPSNAQAQRNLSGAHVGIAIDFGANGAWADAIANYEASFAIRRRLAGADPSDILLRRGLAYDLERVGGFYASLGHTADALKYHEESLALFRRLAEADPADADSRRALAYGLERFGRFRFTAKDLDGALEYYRESLAIRRRLLVENPSDDRTTSDQSRALLAFGELQTARQDEAGALGSYEESLALQRRLAEASPADDLEQSALADRLRTVGSARAEKGDLDGALARFEEALAIRRRLAGAEPIFDSFLRSLADALRQVADIRLARRDRAGARRDYEESLAIRQRLSEADPSDVRSRDDVLAVAGRLGTWAYRSVMSRDAPGALEVSDRIIALAPEIIWLHSNRAHALMLLGRLDQARGVYLKYRGQIAQDDKPWEVVIAGDFAEMRKADIAYPLMDEIEAAFAKP